MILTGNTKIKLFAGDTKVRFAYVGTAKVYPNSSLAVTASLAFTAAGGTGVLSILVEDGQSWSVTGLPAGWSASPPSGSGPTTVTVTAANNTTAQVKGGTITVISEDLSAGCSVSQAAGAIVYGTPVVTAFGYPDIPAGGGTVSPNAYNYQQVYTWNGVPGSGGVLTTGGTIYYSNTSGLVSAGSRGEVTGGRWAVWEMATRVDMNGVAGQNAVCVVYQQANSMSYGDHYLDISVTGRSFPSDGGSSTVTVEPRQHVAYTSGARSSVSTSREPQVAVFGAGLSCVKLTPGGISRVYEYRATMTANTSTNSRSGSIRFSLAIAPVVQTVNFSQAGVKEYRLRIGGTSTAGVPFEEWATVGWFAVGCGTGNGSWQRVGEVEWVNIRPEVWLSWRGDYPYVRILGSCNPAANAKVRLGTHSTVIISGETISSGSIDCILRLDSPNGNIAIEPQR